VAAGSFIHRRLFQKFYHASKGYIASKDCECSYCIKDIPIIPADSKCLWVSELGSPGWVGPYHFDCWKALAGNEALLASFDPLLGPTKDEIDREIQRQAWLGEDLDSILSGEGVVHHESGCILSLNGYADCRPRKRIKGRREPLYRITYRLYYGSLEPGVPVMHLCHVPLCINPFHLRAGSNSENMQDAETRSKGRWPGFTPCERVQARLEERSRFLRLHGDPDWQPDNGSGDSE
jgi:hypothetical protein